MPDPDVVAYLRANLPKFSVEDLRKQLGAEGVSDADFAQCLKLAQAPAPKTPLAKKAVVVALGGALALAVVLLLVVALARKPAGGNTPPAAGDESAYLGHSGYVVHLPAGYAAVPTFRDGVKDDEIVYFCKKGTDPTNFLDQGLYGQLGIVRLEVVPDPLAGATDGLDILSQRASAASAARKEKFHTKNLQVSSLRGFELDVETPFARTEAYILGKKVRYVFTAGQDDEIYRDIVTSLRDPQSESAD